MEGKRGDETEIRGSGRQRNRREDIESEIANRRAEKEKFRRKFDRIKMMISTDGNKKGKKRQRVLDAERWREKI